jgi:hypothetical protein
MWMNEPGYGGRVVTTKAKKSKKENKEELKNSLPFGFPLLYLYFSLKKVKIILIDES